MKLIVKKLVLIYIILNVIIYIEIENVDEINYTLIEIKSEANNNIQYSKSIDKHFVVYNIRNTMKINKSSKILYVEHNYLYDDLAFLIPLYSIMIKTKNIIICNDSGNVEFVRYKRNFQKLYFVCNSCIIFDIEYLRLLHIHNKLFKLCKFERIYYLAQKNILTSSHNSICKSNTYSYKHSIVTTLYKRNNLHLQLKFFKNQSLPPQHIIIVHDRNFMSFDSSLISDKIIYVHTINFKAGFYFRYLVSLLSPEDEVLIYDDDWFPTNLSSHQIWFNQLNGRDNSIICHHSGEKNSMKWCATPLILHRKWLYLMWCIRIYNKYAVEDGHLSFSSFLLCNIRCIRNEIKGLKYKSDNLSSSIKIITSNLWNNYSLYSRELINSTYIYRIKSKYKIY